MSQLDEVLVVHIKRNANSVAPNLVGVAKMLGSRMWVGTVPIQVLPLVCNDFDLC